MLDLREWSLELEAPSVDTTSVSEKFGEAVKSLVRGGGSTEFFVERQCLTDYQADSNTLMKLLFMTEKGCNADAKFYLIREDVAKIATDYSKVTCFTKPTSWSLPLLSMSAPRR